MKSTSMVFKPTLKLTVQELRAAIALGAERKYYFRLTSLAYWDWSTACSMVKTCANPCPTDEEIRPTAYRVYLERVKNNIVCDCLSAIHELRQEGILYPTETQIRERAATIYNTREWQASVRDWLGVEALARSTGYICVPSEW